MQPQLTSEVYASGGEGELQVMYSIGSWCMHQTSSDPCFALSWSAASLTSPALLPNPSPSIWPMRRTGKGVYTVYILLGVQTGVQRNRDEKFGQTRNDGSAFILNDIWSMTAGVAWLSLAFGPLPHMAYRVIYVDDMSIFLGRYLNIVWCKVRLSTYLQQSSDLQERDPAIQAD
jgi:hypothetical protein